MKPGTRGRAKQAALTRNRPAANKKATAKPAAGQKAARKRRDAVPKAKATRRRKAAKKGANKEPTMLETAIQALEAVPIP